MTIASRLYDNAERVWREMYAQAVPVAALSGPDAYLRDYCPAGTLGVYVGALTQLFQGLGLKSAQQYHHCKLCLIQMGTIAQLRRGSAHRLSAWVLLAEPTPELYDTRTGPGVANGRRRRDSTPMVPATEVLQPDGLASFLAKSPAGRVEELRAMTSAASYLAVRALVEEASTSANSQARVAAARTLLALNRDVGGLESDPWTELAGELREDLHATPARS